MTRPSSLSHIVLTGAESSRQRLMSWQAALSLTLNSRNTNIKISHVCPAQDENDTDHGVVLEPKVVSMITACGLTETELIEQCDGAYHCAERFIGWSSENQDYYHTHHDLGVNLNGIEFQHYLTRYRQNSPIELVDYSLTAQCAYSERFTLPIDDPHSVLSTLHYRIVVSASKYTALVRKLALQLGVVEVLGKIANVQYISSQSERYDPTRYGFIDSILLESGLSLTAEFFIDCAGYLTSQKDNFADIGQHKLTTEVAPESVIYGSSDEKITPSLSSVCRALPECYYRLTTTGAREYIEIHYDPTQLTASEVLKNASEHTSLDKFSFVSPVNITPSLCYAPWSRNVLVIGTQACQIGQTIGTELHNLVDDLERFVALFPNAACDEHLRKHYNSQALDNYQQLIDWHHLPYKQANWRTGQFWKHVSSCERSEQLNRICSLFKQTGCFPVYEYKTYTKSQWISYLLGFELWPQHYDPILSRAEDRQVAHFLSTLSSKIKSVLPAIPKYRQNSHL